MKIRRIREITCTPYISYGDETVIVIADVWSAQSRKFIRIRYGRYLLRTISYLTVNNIKFIVYILYRKEVT